MELSNCGGMGSLSESWLPLRTLHRKEQPMSRGRVPPKFDLLFRFIFQKANFGTWPRCASACMWGNFHSLGIGQGSPSRTIFAVRSFLIIKYLLHLRVVFRRLTQSTQGFRHSVKYLLRRSCSIVFNYEVFITSTNVACAVLVRDCYPILNVWAVRRFDCGTWRTQCFWCHCNNLHYLKSDDK